MTQHYDVLIVGAGHAGTHCATLLRQLGFGGSIAMASDETGEPYERPPLSKEYLLGLKSFADIAFFPDDFWAKKGLAILQGKRVTAIAAQAHEIICADGTRLSYGKLVWAAGGRARRLSCPGAELHGIHTIRSRADADALRAELDATRHAVIIGAGYIGLEAAAVLVKLGKQVTVLEMQERVLARVATPLLSRFVMQAHETHGVTFRLGARLAGITGQNGRVSGVQLADGSTLPAELVIAGIGINPAMTPLAGAGASVSNGVEVDARCRTSLPDIYAIGDCACQENQWAGGKARLESVQNATHQAKLAAHDIAGKQADDRPVPWFWSNQYDLKLQMLGLPAGYDESVVRGDQAGQTFSILYLRGRRLIALDAVNAPKDYVQAKKLIESGVMLDSACLADPSADLKSFWPA